MREKVLKSAKYKQARKDGTLNSQQLSIVPRKDYTIEEELHGMLDSMPNSTLEEVLSMERDVFEEVVEGFVAVQNIREDVSS